MTHKYDIKWKEKISKNVKESDYFKNLKNISNQKIESYQLSPKLCLYCNQPIPYEKRFNKFCSCVCSGFATTKGRHHSIETKLKISNSNQGISPWNKGKYEIPRVAKTCPICATKFITSTNGIFCSKKCFTFDQKNGYIFSKLGNKGGYQPGSGRGKSGWYQNIFCNSTYELAWVIYNLEHNIQFERNQQGFTYTFENKVYKYYPDFIQGEEYIEIKGFLRPNDKFKFEQFPRKLKILYGKDIKEQIDYCKHKYGYHFEELYEGNPHNTKLNKCIICGNPAHNKCCSQKCSGMLVVKSKMALPTGVEPISLD